MGKTNVATTDALRVQVWEEELYRDMRQAAFFNNFTSKDTNNIVQEKTSLEKKKGDKETFGIRYRLTGAGVQSGETLEGREEKLKTADFSVELERYRHAVRDDGDLTRRRPVYDMAAESRDALKDWGVEKIDRLHFQTALASPTKILYPVDTYSAITDITAADKLTPKLISQIKTGAMTGWGRRQVPFRPIMIGGKKFYVLLVSNDVKFDLQQDPTYNQAVRECEARGKDHPIFTGALAMWDNVVVHEHDMMQEYADVTNFGAGADVPGSTCLFMGAQALVCAWGERPNVVERDFDYGEEFGYAIRMTMKVGKPKFTKPGSSAADYAIAALKVARTQISDK